MAHTSTTITAQVSVTDIMAVLGESTTNVIDLCQSSKINHWGGGPFNYPLWSFYSEDDTLAQVRAKRAAARKEANQGWAISAFTNPLMAVTASKAGQSSWSWIPVSVCRSDDFDLYNHVAVNPYIMEITTDSKTEIRFGGLDSIQNLPSLYDAFAFLASQGQYDTAYIGLLLYKPNMSSGSVILTSPYRGADEMPSALSITHATGRNYFGSGDFKAVPVIFLSNSANLTIPYVISGETNVGSIYLLPSPPVNVHIKTESESALYPSEAGIYIEYMEGSGYVDWAFNGFNGYVCNYAFEVTVYNDSSIARQITVEFDINGHTMAPTVPAYSSVTRRFTGRYDSIIAPKENDELSVPYTLTVAGFTKQTGVLYVRSDGGSLEK